MEDSDKKDYILFSEDENNFIYVVRPIDQFVHDSLFAQQADRGVSVLRGTHNDDPSVNETMQAILFSKSVFNREQAEVYFEKYIKENIQGEVPEQKEIAVGDKEITITLKNFSDLKLREIKGVEIFAAGKWNGDEYTIEDLDEMVRAFNDEGNKIRPVLKLGHNDEQEMLKADGLPAAGWIGDIYRQGDKLFADFVDIPRKIFDLIKNKAFRKVSSEIYWNLKVGDKLYKRLLSAVALLGSDMPAVSTLDDILALYGLKAESKTYKEESKFITYEKKEHSMSDEKLKDLETKVNTYKADIDQKDADLKAKDDELAELKKFKADQEAKNEELRLEKEELERNNFVAELEKEDLCTKAMKPYVLEFLQEKKTYSIDKKEMDKAELLKEMLKLFKAQDSVNFDESSEDGDKKSEDDMKKIEKYAQENKISFAKAYKILKKGE